MGPFTFWWIPIRVGVDFLGDFYSREGNAVVFSQDVVVVFCVYWRVFGKVLRGRGHFLANIRVLGRGGADEVGPLFAYAGRFLYLPVSSSSNSLYFSFFL